MKKDNHIITFNKIKEWLSKQEVEKIMKPIRKKKQADI